MCLEASKKIFFNRSFLLGSRQFGIQIDNAHASLKYCEQAQLKILPGASHFVQEDEPDTVNQYMEEFLNSH
jgi:pimeloyl-ACP methyl ester carboxylesterase